MEGEAAALPFEWSQLVVRLQAGDAAAAQEFARRLSPGLNALLRQHGCDADERAELVQECLEAALRAIQARRLGHPNALPAFVRATALNLATDRGRKRQRQREVKLSDESWENLPAESIGPAELLEQESAQALLKRCLEDLPVARDREILWQFYVLEHEKQQICGRFALSSEHFDRVIHRARRRFRAIWELRAKSH